MLGAPPSPPAYVYSDVRGTVLCGVTCHCSMTSRRVSAAAVLRQVKGGAADSEGSLRQGDQILKVNQEDLKEAQQEEAAALLKVSCSPPPPPPPTISGALSRPDSCTFMVQAASFFCTFLCECRLKQNVFIFSFAVKCFSMPHFRCSISIRFTSVLLCCQCLYSLIS